MTVQDHICAFGMYFWDKAAFDHDVLMSDEAHLYCRRVLETDSL